MANRHNYASDQLDKFVLRLPAGMRQQIAEKAKENGRSMNAEIVARLEHSLRDELNQKVDLAVREGSTPHPDIAKLVTNLVQTANDEEQTLLRHYRSLPYATRTPIQSLLQALVNPTVG